MANKGLYILCDQNVTVRNTLPQYDRGSWQRKPHLQPSLLVTSLARAWAIAPASAALQCACVSKTTSDRLIQEGTLKMQDRKMQDW